LTDPLPGAGPAARKLEEQGYYGAWVAETKYDPFLPILAAAEETERLQLGTSIAVAFARSPMTVAMTANDLHRACGGRFVLGLGTQVKPHIERRYSMPWSHPAERMREYVSAIRAIWRSWNEGVPLEFRGRFYRHDLMTPFFSPEPNPYGAPKIFVAGVGPRMTAVAGAAADGFFCHAFTTEKHVREVTLPALTAARADAGRDMSDFEIYGSLFVVTGTDATERAEAAKATKRQIAFYGSTPSYRSVLDLHGWGDLQPQLNVLAKAGRWGDMEELVTDEMLSEFAVVAEPDRVGIALRARYGDTLTRVSLYLNGPIGQDIVEQIARDITSDG
jgi:probable F420-dependent oxidoreductase